MRVPVSHFALPTTQEVIRAGRLSQLPLHPKVAFNFLKLLKRVAEEINLVESAKLAAFKKFGQEYEDKETKQPMLQIPPEKMEEFAAAMKELTDVEIGLPFDPIKIEDFGDEKLSAQEVAALEPFLAE